MNLRDCKTKREVTKLNTFELISQGLEGRKPKNIYSQCGSALGGPLKFRELLQINKVIKIKWWAQKDMSKRGNASDKSMKYSTLLIIRGMQIEIVKAIFTDQILKDK